MSLSLYFRRPLTQHTQRLERERERILARSRQADQRKRQQAARASLRTTLKTATTRIWHALSLWLVVLLIVTIIMLGNVSNRANHAMAQAADEITRLRNTCGKPTRLILAGAPADIARQAREITNDIDRDETILFAQRASQTTTR